MKAKRQPVKLHSKRRAPLGAQALVLGVDGGGTKTRAVVVGARGRVLGEGEAGPSNPLRVGVSEAAHAIREAAERACAAAGVRRIEIAAAEVGLAGVKRADIRERMRAALKSELGIKSTDVVTDADIALYGATEGKPGLVIIAGTGSICCGVNARGRHAIEAAKRRDHVAREIVEEAGRELAHAAVAVVRRLRMEHEQFQVAYVGGVFAAGALMLDPLREEVTALAPRAYLAPPVLTPAEAA